MGCCNGSDAVDDVDEQAQYLLGSSGTTSLQTGAATCSQPVQQPARILRMYLDADRDGHVDGQPANYGNWQWGAQATGGILLVRTVVYQGGQDVAERAELRFRWDNDQPEAQQGWAATLQVSHPQRIRIYPGRQFDAQAQPLNLGAGLDLTALQGEQDTGRIRLWMEAADYGSDAQEGSWRITLTFTFRPIQGGQVQQTAELRIAPWIMASDLETTARVFGVGPNPLADYPEELSDFVTGAGAAFVRLNEAGGIWSKPFVRDVVKCGFGHAPHFQHIVIQTDLDSQSVYSIQNNPQAAGAGKIRRPLQNPDPSSQDNGGNLLVSPPITGYPLGRIIYGEAQNFVCNAGGFYRNQKMQTPIVIDPTWLSVGHVDEMLSFVPNPNGANADDPWPWKILLLSPRLGYILAYAASAQPNPQDIGPLITTARQVNDASRGNADDWAALLQRCQQAFGNRIDAGQPQQPVALGNYQADPNPPQGQNGRAVFWNAGNNNNYRIQDIDAYLSRPVSQDNNNSLSGTLFDAVQPRIDQARQTLRQELAGHQAQQALAEAYVVEIPALLDFSDSVVTDTADSVNMLVLRTGANAASCLVPKPFGPVCGGAYIFQECIREDLEDTLGLAVQFVNEWAYLHRHHGEVHCGTNQVPAPLANNRAWWRQAPP